MAQEAKTMDEAWERIEKVAKEKNVVINEGHGPAFDAPQCSSETSLLDDDTK
jgi:hypothetical protein